MNNVLISVIIPAYNAEKYLKECLDSVLNQTLKNIEIILIDDGSTDSSLDICKQYKNEHSNIVLLLQKNSGSGKARNAGIETAKGEFVVFLDSDDYYPENDILETLYNTAVEHNVKICGGSFSELCDNVIIKDYSGICDDGYTFQSNELINYKDYQFDYGYHRFIYNLQFLKDNNLRFPDYRRFQDPPFFAKAMYYAEKFYAIQKITYMLRTSHKTIKWKQPQQLGLLNGIYDNLNFAKQHNLKKLYYLTLLRLQSHKYVFSAISIAVLFKLQQIFSSIDYNFILNEYPEAKQSIKFNSLVPFFLLKIFSLKNINERKVLTILGISIKFRRPLNKEEKNIYSNFTKHPVKNNSVLLIEVNDFHSETLPGMAKYFLDLGFNVDIIISNEEYALKPLCRITNENLKIYPMSDRVARKILKNKIANQYEYIYFNSDRHGSRSYYDYFKPNKKLTEKIINMCHRPDTYNSPIKKLLMLAPLPLKDKDRFKVVNTHYFGEIVTNPKNETTNFIVIGNIENKRKNHNLLYEAVQDLVNKGVTNFKITVVARIGQLNTPQNIKEYFDFKGRLDYEKMYEALEKADFFLTLLDPENPEHDRYIETGTSGSFQLIYGFRKPCLINKKFASLHGFTNENSIVYKNNSDLSQAMLEAINMNKEAYKNKQVKLAGFADDLYKKSLENLKEIL